MLGNKLLLVVILVGVVVFVRDHPLDDEAPMTFAEFTEFGAGSSRKTRDADRAGCVATGRPCQYNKRCCGYCGVQSQCAPGHPPNSRDTKVFINACQPTGKKCVYTKRCCGHCGPGSICASEGPVWP